MLLLDILTKVSQKFPCLRKKILQLRKLSYVCYELIRRIKMKAEKLKPTESELEILNILWDKGTATVRDVHEVLETYKPSGYTTTLKLMQIMFEKGMLTREAKGKQHVYKAIIRREKAQEQLLKKMIDTMFSGSASQLVMQALGNYKSSPEELEEIKAYLSKLSNKS